MPSNERLSEFVAVVAEGSISAAARVLALPRSTLSRRISGLEAELGVRLLHRSTSRLVLTEAGNELNRRARRIEADAAETWNAVRRLDNTPRGVLRVSTSGSLMDALLVDYADAFPQVRLEVLDTTRRVDLVGEGFDIALRFGPVRDPDLIVRRLASVRAVVVASPSYLECEGTPQCPEDLSDHACLTGFGGDENPHRRWAIGDGAPVSISGPLSGSSRRFLRVGALHGLGLAFLPWLSVRDALDDGRLVEVLADEVTARTMVSLVIADREYIEPKVREFVDRAVPFLQQSLANGD